jgi:hypothetical protein
MALAGAAVTTAVAPLRARPRAVADERRRRFTGFLPDSRFEVLET